jgi:hypothetical protein
MGQGTVSREPAQAQSNESRGGIEQRKAPRKKVLLTSKLVYGDGAYVLDCTIRDISATGAFITLSQRGSIPNEVYLLDLANRVAYQATVVSERSSGYGIKFLKTYPLAQISAPELRYLKRIWLDSAQ